MFKVILWLDAIIVVVVRLLPAWLAREFRFLLRLRLQLSACGVSFLLLNALILYHQLFRFAPNHPVGEVVFTFWRHEYEAFPFLVPAVALLPPALNDANGKLP